MDGVPLEVGTYTQTAVCPSQSWPNGYVILNGGKDVMSIPFDTDSLVFVPETSTNYAEFKKAMESYDKGNCFSMNENMATLLYGGIIPPGPGTA
jgi:hypothetical protein